MTELKPGRGEQMNYEDYIEQGLNGEAPLKLIMRGSIQNSGNEKVGVVSGWHTPPWTKNWRRAK